ncbi:hypothetical protein FG05_35271 [Fusarium graminearum]|nr:hypothetical protein FG05_35271 [Fusarium graminearum]
MFTDLYGVSRSVVTAYLRGSSRSRLGSECDHNGAR